MTEDMKYMRYHPFPVGTEPLIPNPNPKEEKPGSCILLISEERPARAARLCRVARKVRMLARGLTPG